MFKRIRNYKLRKTTCAAPKELLARGEGLDLWTAGRLSKEKEWAVADLMSDGPCRQLVIAFVDGSVMRANFKFK